MRIKKSTIYTIAILLLCITSCGTSNTPQAKAINSEMSLSTEPSETQETSEVSTPTETSLEDSNTNNVEEQPEVSEEERQAYYEAEQESLPDYLKDNQETTPENSNPQKEVIKIYDPVKYPSFGDNDWMPVTSESYAKEIRKNRDTFEKYYNEESYGTYTKGKVEGELPYVGDTNYDPSVIIDAYTDKGFLIQYDTSTGRVYYSGMTLPTGGGFMDMASDTVLGQYCMDHMYNSRFDLTYAEMQQLLGTYDGN